MTFNNNNNNNLNLYSAFHKPKVALQDMFITGTQYKTGHTAGQQDKQVSRLIIVGSTEEVCLEGCFEDVQGRRVTDVLG